MAYHIANRHPLKDSILQAAIDQTDKSVQELASNKLDAPAVVRRCRKRCKKIRAALRLLRPCLDDYSSENKYFRDIARHLADARDSDAYLETFTDLLARDGRSSYTNQLQKFKHALLENQSLAHEELEATGYLGEPVTEDLEQGRQRLQSLDVHADSSKSAIRGLKKTYHRAAKQWKTIKEEDRASGEAYHELRKRVKYHRYHLKILQPIWKTPLKARRKECKALSDVLGDHHDLLELRTFFNGRQSVIDRPEQMLMLLNWIDDDMIALESAARPLAERVFAEKPKHLLKCYAAYATTWQAEQTASA